MSKIVGTQHKQTTIRQKEIIKAARTIIIKCGSENLTIRKLAKEVGLTEGALYKHFKSKRDILYFLIDYVQDTLIEDLIKSKDKTASKILENVIVNLQKRKGVSFQVIAEIISLGDKQLNRRILEAITTYIESLKSIFKLGVDSREFRQDLDIDAAANLYFNIVQGVVNIWALNGYNFDLFKKYTPQWELFKKSIRNST